MKKLLIGLLAMGAASAQASMLEINGSLSAELFSAQVNEEKTYFETLGDLYMAGKRPDLTKISNIAWAGRCFSKNKPNDPTNAGYIFRQKVSDVGPIGAESKSYESLSYWQLDEAPNYFDNLSLQQVYALNLRTAAFDAKIKNVSIEINLNATSKSNLKVSDSFLIEQISGTDTGVGPIGIGIRCYYFIPDLKP